ncbi:SHOCT domain-containing protein [Actinophytocola sediminis]
MTWQESLRQLDARLAKGEIGAAEYRKSRDQILAEASSGAPAPGRQSRDDLWAAAETKAAHDEEAVVSAETTLVVKVDAPPQPAAAEVTVEDETTQVVTADQIPRTQPPPPPLPQAPPIGAPGQLGPPGVRPTPYRSAPIQGQEVFAETSSANGAMFMRFLVPLLVLALVGAGVWWFLLRDDGDQNTANQPPPSTTEQQQAGVDQIAGLLPELPGKANENNGTMALDQARELKLFTPTYATLLADNGASEVAYRGAIQRGVGYLLVASPIPPANGADGVAVLTREHLQRAGFAPAEKVSPNDPPVITRVDATFRTFIAVYATGDTWVQLNVSGPPKGDEAALRTEFQKILGSLTERLPAE